MPDLGWHCSFRVGSMKVLQNFIATGCNCRPSSPKQFPHQSNRSMRLLFVCIILAYAHIPGATAFRPSHMAFHVRPLARTRHPLPMMQLSVGTAKQFARPIVSPSVAKANFLNLGADLHAAVDGGAEWLHFSVQVKCRDERCLRLLIYNRRKGASLMRQGLSSMITCS